MKRKTILFTIVTIWALLGGQGLALVATPEIVIDGRTLYFDVAPQIEDGRLLVPLRGVFEALGAEVDYEPTVQTVRAVKGGDEIILRIGSSRALVNGRVVVLEAPARIVGSRTFIPLRFVSEALGAEVFWDEADRKVLITSQEEPPQGVPLDYADGTGIHRVYRWTFDGKAEITEILVNSARYDYYRGLDRVPSDDYSIYVTHPDDDRDMRAFVAQFRKVADSRGYSERRLMEYVITFVQSMKYTLDSEANGIEEYPQYPLETLAVKGGDCEDTSILLAALLKTMGYETLIVHYPGIHTGVGLWMAGEDGELRYEYNGRTYTYVETTIPYSIGKIPPEFQGLKPTFFTLVPRPAVRFRWETTSDGIDVHVTNEGTGAAERLSVRAGFEGRDGKLYNQADSGTHYVESGETLRVQLSLRYVTGMDYRYVVGVYNNGKLMAEDRSQWFGTGN